MAISAEIQRKQINDALKRLVHILARQAARQAFEQQNLGSAEEVRSDRTEPKNGGEQS